MTTQEHGRDDKVARQSSGRRDAQLGHGLLGAVCTLTRCSQAAGREGQSTRKEVLALREGDKRNEGLGKRKQDGNGGG